MIGLQFVDFTDKLGGFLESPIHAGKTDVGHFVNVAQRFHDAFANGHSRDFAIIFDDNFVHDGFDQIFDGFGADGTFLAGFLEAGEEFFPGELLAAAIALYDHQALIFNFFIGGEAMIALQTLAAAANSRAFAGSPRIDDLIILIAALWTAHKNRTNHYLKWQAIS